MRYVIAEDHETVGEKNARGFYSYSAVSVHCFGSQIKDAHKFPSMNEALEKISKMKGPATPNNKFRIWRADLSASWRVK